MTLADLFDRAVATHCRESAMTLWGPTVAANYSTPAVKKEVARLAAGLIALGVKKGDRVLLISENRPEWAIVDYATIFSGGVLVPIYTSLIVEQLRYILDNSGATIAVASTQELLDKLLAAAEGLDTLKQAIVIEQGAAAEDVMHLSSVCAMGDDLLARSPDAWRAPASRLRDEDVATIIYTSGTTGPPKGVILSHRNIVSNVSVLSEVLDFRSDDTALSFLPLCHITQRLADYCYFFNGVHVVYVKLEDVAASLVAVRPTTFPGVPRVYEKTRDRIEARIAHQPAPLRALLRWAIGVGREMGECLIEGIAPSAWLKLRHKLADLLALSRVRNALGGRLRYLVSGGAPLNPDLMRSFLALGLPILEGYGLTETTVLTINRPDRFRPGTVGPPLPGVELKIAPDGEIIARSPGVGRGYYLDVKRSAEVFVDGWFSTGDLGRFDEQGNLVITGRKKDLLVTSGGKKVSPALIEQSILLDQLVSQIVLVGDGRKFVSALVVPDRERLLAWCREHGLNGVAFEQLIDQPEVRRVYEGIIAQRNQHLSGYEQIKKFALLSSELTVEGGELTPTLKVRRRVVEEKFRHIIDSMYAETKEA